MSNQQVSTGDAGDWQTAGRNKKRRREHQHMDTSATDSDQLNQLPDGKKQRPYFPPISCDKLTGGIQIRKVPVPAHRYTPLKENWMKLFTPVVENLHLQIRFNLKTRQVEIRTCEATDDVGSVQKAADFVRAFVLGFEVDDALALLRLDDLFIDSFDVQDVKQLKGDHLSRAIGRLAGRHGKTKYTIENHTRTRIVVADSRIHILGAFANIAAARRALCELILGSPPSKVFGHIRNVVVM